MKAADLRKSILQAAVHGKLVPQDKNDEPASELLKRIRTEKATLVQEGKLKKEKPLPPIAENEIPYDLPEGWEWCRLGDIIHLLSGRDLEPNAYNNKKKGIPYITGASSFVGNLIDVVRWTEKPVVISEAGDILLSCKGTIGKVVLNRIGNCHIARQIMAIRIPYSDVVDIYFLLIIVRVLVPKWKEQAQSMIPGISRENVLSISCTLPPLAEQRRIVAKVDELMVLCDELEAAEKKLDALESHFAQYLPKSILQAAVQGKLAPQDKNDEPASELLERIRAEKAELVKNGKLKKEKPLPPIAENKIPYDLPEGWEWCRLGEVCDLYTGNSINATEKNKKYTGLGSGRCYIGTKDVDSNHNIDYENGIKIPCEIGSFREAPEGAILLCIEGGSAGRKIGITNRTVCFGNKLCCFKVIGFEKRYLYYYLQSPMLVHSFMGGMTGIIGGVSVSSLKQLPIVIPPLAEQQRIVAKVDELMSLCDELKCVGSLPIDHGNVIPFPAKNEAEDVELIKMAAQGKVAMQPSKQHAAALNDLLKMMDDV